MDELEPSLKIRTKVVHILVTKACNLTCGDCNQLIGHFPKQKILHTPVADIRRHIQVAIEIAREDWSQPWFPPRHRHLSLYGGEPTVHPQWSEILRMLYHEFPEWPFVILTNGWTFEGHELPQSGDEQFEYIKHRPDIKAHDKNIFWRIDPKDASRSFLPTLVAPMDMLGDPDPLVYFDMAKQNCPHYDTCETLIYHDKGYFCVNAGPMDWLFHDGANGWDILGSSHPFKRTNEEVEAQAKLFCRRCHYCLGRTSSVDGQLRIPDQPINAPSLVSEINYPGIKPGSGQLISLEGCST